MPTLSKRFERRRLLDRVRVQANGGRGGRGVQAFEPRASGKKMRIGAHGGPGGDVVIRASAGMAELNMDTFVFNGGDGGDATGGGRAGAAGKACVVHVPPGTRVSEVEREYVVDDSLLPDEYFDDEAEDEDEDGGGTKRVFLHEGAHPDAIRSMARAAGARIPYRDALTLLADLVEPGDEVLVASGGQAGAGNRSFGRHEDWPETPHIAGEPGETRFLELEMRLLAQVGLVGFPNAGKSTLLRGLSKAKPTVAPFPFTTLSPVLGTVRYADGHSLCVADVPGLIAGASENRGLGHDFLRHLQRTAVLVYVVDAARTKAPEDDRAGVLGQDPVHDLRVLQAELREYDPELPRRPSLVVANKCDLPEAAQGVAALRAATSLPVIELSAKCGQGQKLLADSLRWMVEQHARA